MQLQSGTRDIGVRFDSKTNGTGALRQFVSKATRLSSRVAFCYLRLVPGHLVGFSGLGRMLQRTLPAGFIAPCLPTKAHTLPSGGLWLHEIKHDGFRIIGRKDGERVGSTAGRAMT